MKPARFEQFFAVRRFNLLSNLDFSPDGSRISYCQDTSGQFNLWTSPVDGGWQQQLTSFEDSSARFHAWTRTGFAIAVDHHGDELWQVHRLPEAGGWPEDLTRRPDARFQFGPGGVDESGRRLLIAGNATRPADLSIYELDLESGERKPLIKAEGNWTPGAWHPDGRRFLATRLQHNTDQDVYLADSGGGEPLPLTPHEGNQVNFPVGFDAAGERWFCVTDQGSDFLWLAAQPLAGGERVALLRAEWDVEHAVLSGDRRRLACSINEDGSSRFRVLDLESGRELPVPALPEGLCKEIALSPDGRLLAAVIGTATRTMDIYVADLEAQTQTRITSSFLGGIPEEELVSPELVRITSFDGTQVPAWVYRPAGEGPFPVLVSIHGGPESQERPGQTAGLSFYQYLLSRGVAVLAPNIRGSTGYGLRYQRAIYRDWGGAELKDIEACARWLQSQEWVDSGRLSVYGGSFGGFATLSAMTRLPQYWACGVDLVGPSNLVSFARAVPPHWRKLMRSWVGDPDDDEALLRERSPITYVDCVRAPLLVLQGAQDPRVVKGESDQMVQRLKELGREVEYHVFEDEGHGFTKRANQIKAYSLIGEFLFKHLEVGS